MASEESLGSEMPYSGPSNQSDLAMVKQHARSFAEVAERLVVDVVILVLECLDSKHISNFITSYYLIDKTIGSFEKKRRTYWLVRPHHSKHNLSLLE